MDKDIILIDKPAGMTSFGVVARVRRVLTQKQQSAFSSDGSGRKGRVKVGHTGTLDPFATGLLILLVGKGTKRSNEFLKLDKWYEATIRLGSISTTGDPEGEITTLDEARVPSLEDVQKVVVGFVGEVEQRVPNFSAVKINGERAYRLARKGELVEMPTREVEIFSIEVLDYKWPELKIRTHVSSGTYIRTLGKDIGEKLGVGGYLTELRRTQIGECKVKDAISLDKLMKTYS